MELPPELKKQASSPESTKKAEQDKVTFSGKNLDEVTLKELEKKEDDSSQKESKADYYELQEDLEKEDKDLKKSASMVGGTRGANQARAQMNKNYKGTLKKVFREKVKKNFKNQKKK